MWRVARVGKALVGDVSLRHGKEKRVMEMGHIFEKPLTDVFSWLLFCGKDEGDKIILGYHNKKRQKSRV